MRVALAQRVLSHSIPPDRHSQTHIQHTHHVPLSFDSAHCSLFDEQLTPILRRFLRRRPRRCVDADNTRSHTTHKPVVSRCARHYRGGSFALNNHHHHHVVAPAKRKHRATPRHWRMAHWIARELLGEMCAFCVSLLYAFRNRGARASLYTGVVALSQTPGRHPVTKRVTSGFAEHMLRRFMLRTVF